MLIFAWMVFASSATATLSISLSISSFSAPTLVSPVSLLLVALPLVPLIAGEEVITPKHEMWPGLVDGDVDEAEAKTDDVDVDVDVDFLGVDINYHGVDIPSAGDSVNDNEDDDKHKPLDFGMDGWWLDPAVVREVSPPDALVFLNWLDFVQNYVMDYHMERAQRTQNTTRTGTSNVTNTPTNTTANVTTNTTINATNATNTTSTSNVVHFTLALVFAYSKSCPFSKDFSPVFDRLARALASPWLRFLRIPVDNHWWFPAGSISGTPNVFLFHSGRLLPVYPGPTYLTQPRSFGAIYNYILDIVPNLPVVPLSNRTSSDIQTPSSASPPEAKRSQQHTRVETERREDKFGRLRPLVSPPIEWKAPDRTWTLGAATALLLVLVFWR